MTLRNEQIGWVLKYVREVWDIVGGLNCAAIFTLFIFLAGLIAVVVVKCFRRLQIKSASLNVPFKIGSITFETTPTDRIIAWKAYVQLVTRKAALPFDDKHDVIEDVYASMYSLFDTSRDLLSNLPPRSFENPDGISAILLRVINDGLRPHLTRWQSDFRSWMDIARKNDEFQGMSPVALQKLYPDYQKLVEDLRFTNTELIKLADELYLIARGESRDTLAQPAIKPEPPQKNEN